MFKEADTDGSSTLDIDEFHSLAKSHHLWKKHLSKDQTDVAAPAAENVVAAVETETSTENAVHGNHAKFFTNHDLDGSGTLNLGEFIQAYQKTHPNASTADFEAMFKEADTDGSGDLDLDEWHRAKNNHKWKNHLSGNNGDATAKLFKNHDLDGNGSLNLGEFIPAYQTIDPNASKADIEAMFKEADTDGSSTLDIDEFHSLAKSHHLWKKHLSKDQTDVAAPAAENVVAAVETETSTENAVHGNHAKFFTNHDLDGSGTLNLGEFIQAYQKTHPNASTADFEAMFKEADTDGSGDLDLDEWHRAKNNHNWKNHLSGSNGDAQMLNYNAETINHKSRFILFSVGFLSAVMIGYLVRFWQVKMSNKVEKAVSEGGVELTPSKSQIT